MLESKNALIFFFSYKIVTIIIFEVKFHVSMNRFKIFPIEKISN